MIDNPTILSIVSNIQDPTVQMPLSTVATIAEPVRNGECLSLDIALHYPAKSAQQPLREAILSALAAKDVDSVDITVRQAIPAVQAPSQQSIPGVSNIIAIASGKGGVGKSSTAVNLALALQREGASVGLLDADIYGPSQPLMLGVPEGQRPMIKDGQYFMPIEVHGLHTMSMGYMVTEKTPMVWRGPMASGALQQLLQQTAWPALDYLLIDMPPGTGDIQLTLSQQVPVTAAVVVTTPQDIALLDAKKGIEMFNKVSVPCLGVIENMAMYTCENCGHTAHIFGQGGGEKMAAEYAAPLLGSMPLAMAIREGLDKGGPIVAAEPDSIYAERYREMALAIATGLTKLQTSAGPEIAFELE